MNIFSDNLAKYIDQIRDANNIDQRYNLSVNGNTISIKPSTKLDNIFKSNQDSINDYLPILYTDNDKPDLFDIKYYPDRIDIEFIYISLLELLPDEILIDIMTRLKLDQMKGICISSKRLRNICDDNKLWRNKFNIDFGYNPNRINLNMAEAYIFQYKVFSIGRNNRGLFGNGTRSNSELYSDMILPNDIRIKDITTNNSSLIMIDLDGNLWTTGRYVNESLGSIMYSNIPIKYNIDQKIKNVELKHTKSNTTAITAITEEDRLVDIKDINSIYSGPSSGKFIKFIPGDFYTYIDDEYNLWTEGDFPQFQGLNMNNLVGTTLPTINPFVKAKYISSHNNFTMLIDLEDNVWVYGQNFYIDLDDRGTRTYYKPYNLNIRAKKVLTNNSSCFIIGLKNEVYSFGWNYYSNLGHGHFYDINKPTLIPNLRARDISASKTHTLFIDLDDLLLSVGNNEYSQLGYKTNWIMGPKNIILSRTLDENFLRTQERKSIKQIKIVEMPLNAKVHKAIAGDGFSSFIFKY